jgi:hypothetical protein
MGILSHKMLWTSALVKLTPATNILVKIVSQIQPDAVKYAVLWNALLVRCK